MTNATTPTFNLSLYDELLARGLRSGIGKAHSRVCIEQAVVLGLGEPLSDSPTCVTPAVRQYGITINDSQRWSSPAARAAGLQDLGIAQIGSKGVVSDLDFTRLLAERTIRVLIPTLLREVSTDPAVLTAADRCEAEGSADAAYAANAAAHAAARAAETAAHAAASAASAAYAARHAAYAAETAAYIAYAATPDKYLILSAEIAVGVLRDLGSPGVAWL